MLGVETFQRSQVTILGQRLVEAPARLITLFGPRQTGKTTIVLQALQGIYLVFWFGPNLTQRSPSGHRPANPQELRERLEETLSEDEARKISIKVIDVSGDL